MHTIRCATAISTPKDCFIFNITLEIISEAKIILLVNDSFATLLKTFLFIEIFN